MSHAQLENYLIDLIAEEQAKLGYQKESVRLYDPLESLRHFYDCMDSPEEMQQRLADFPEAVADTLGAVEISHVKDRFCFLIPEAGVEYVHTHRKANAFIEQLINLIAGHASLDEVKELFLAQPEGCTFEAHSDGEFDLVVRFTEGEDPYLYCFKDEAGHVTYHRFLPADYEAFGF